jgi:hypothetical protein
LLDALFVAGGALCATLLVYGAWLCIGGVRSSLKSADADPSPGKATGTKTGAAGPAEPQSF